jgi:hypothetical protein
MVFSALSSFQGKQETQYYEQGGKLCKEKRGRQVFFYFYWFYF